RASIRARGSHGRRTSTRWARRSSTTRCSSASRSNAPIRAPACSCSSSSWTTGATRNGCDSLGGSMKRVTGIGGIFFKAKNAPALQAWYKRHLGIDVQAWGGAAFTWTDGEGKPLAGTTAWLITSAESDQFAPSTAPFMVDYRVEDLRAL